MSMTNLINTSKDGVLSGTPAARVAEIAKYAVASGKPILIHLHGGLVSKQTAIAMADRLARYEYGTGDVFPIFIAWETSIPEALRNIREVLNKELFQRLLFRLTKFLAGKIADAVPGAKAAMGGAPEPSNATVEKELAKPQIGEVPFPELDEAEAVADMDLSDSQRLTQDLTADSALQKAWQAEFEEAMVAPVATGGSPVRLRASLVNETAAGMEANSKELVSMAMVVKSGILIAARVIKRFVRHRDHGFHATIVEEILRELFIDDIGAAIWGFMKQDAADTFANEGQAPERGGWFLLKALCSELLALPSGAPAPKISIVGHSAGAIYACELLHHVHASRQNVDHWLSQSRFILDKLVFLAPACTCTLFAETVKAHEEAALFEEFRMFTLTDSDESGYYEVPGLYPRSLLYIISGLLEGAGIVDQPLVGLDRVYREKHPYTDPVVVDVKGFLAQGKNRKVLSGATDGPGLACDSRKHGEFDSTPQTLHSIVTFVCG